MQRKVPDDCKAWVTHYRDTNEILDNRSENLPRRTPTIAVTEVKIIRGETVLAVGYARCSINDQFSKRMGRLIATGRALKYLEENK